MYLLPLICGIALYASTTLAGGLPKDHILWGPGGEPSTLVKRQPATTTSTNAAVAPTRAPDKACSNGAFTRGCWSNGFSISTDFDEKWPNTGKVRSYHLEITNTTCAPDGITRDCLLLNGQYPGPTIVADWGDMIEVTVKNSMKNNGTGKSC
jgi:hypothetical protein